MNADPVADQAAADPGTPPNGNGHGGAPAAGLAGLIDELGKTEQGLASKIDRGKAALAARTAQQQQVKKQLVDLERAATAIAMARAETATASTDAKDALDAVDPLIEEMEDDVKAGIQGEIAGIDKRISDKGGELTTAREALDGLRAEHQALERSLATKQAAYDRAKDALTQLPADLTALIATMRRTRTDMLAAHATGQNRRVFVLSEELRRHQTDLDEKRAPEHEQALVTTFDDASDALDNGRAESTAKQAAVSDQEGIVTALAKERDTLVKGRKVEIEKLYVAPADEASAAQAPKGA